MSLRSRLMATFYDSAMKKTEAKLLRPYRQKLIAPLTGCVLEIGSGTGVNIPFYQNIDRLICSEPDEYMRQRLVRKIAAHKGFQIELLSSAAEQIEMEDDSIDVVVATLVLCSVEDQEIVLEEIKRVLKPGGHLVFLEHVCSHNKKIREWQHRLTPTWTYLFDNCHLNRRTCEAIESAGFDIEIEKIAFNLLPVLNSWVLGKGQISHVSS